MNKDIKDMSVQELKALAYDLLAQIQQNQNNLQVVNQLIAEKSKPSDPVKSE